MKKYTPLFLFFLLAIALVSSQRLPNTASDLNTWGDLLNAYLNASHTPNGTLKAGLNASFFNLNATSGLRLPAESNGCLQTTSGLVSSTGVACGGSGTDVTNNSYINVTGITVGTFGINATGEINSTVGFWVANNRVLTQLDNLTITSGIGTRLRTIEDNQSLRDWTNAVNITFQTYLANLNLSQTAWTNAVNITETSFQDALNNTVEADIALRLKNGTDAVFGRLNATLNMSILANYTYSIGNGSCFITGNNSAIWMQCGLSKDGVML